MSSRWGICHREPPVNAFHIQSPGSTGIRNVRPLGVFQEEHSQLGDAASREASSEQGLAVPHSVHMLQTALPISMLVILALCMRALQSQVCARVRFDAVLGAGPG